MSIETEQCSFSVLSYNQASDDNSLDENQNFDGQEIQDFVVQNLISNELYQEEHQNQAHQKALLEFEQRIEANVNSKNDQPHKQISVDSKSNSKNTTCEFQTDDECSDIFGVPVISNDDILIVYPNDVDQEKGRIKEQEQEKVAKIVNSIGQQNALNQRSEKVRQQVVKEVKRWSAQDTMKFEIICACLGIKNASTDKIMQLACLSQPKARYQNHKDQLKQKICKQYNLQHPSQIENWMYNKQSSIAARLQDISSKWYKTTQSEVYTAAEIRKLADI